MNKKNIFITGAVLFIIGGAIASYFLFFQPNRDTQGVESAFTVSSEKLVQDCLVDINKVNSDLLSENGESTVFVVEGDVVLVEKDQNEQLVAYLFGGENSPMVRCTFLKEHTPENVQKGMKVKVKGVFRSCSEIDEDLDLLEDAVVDQCALID